MGFATLLAKSLLHLALGMLLLQFGSVPPENTEDPFSRATTPTSEFLYFNDDFSSGNLDRFFSWINPERGIVTNGILLSKEEAEDEFRTLFQGSDSGNLQEANLHFNFGEFAGRNTYQADVWLEMKIRSGGTDSWYRMHHALVFEIEGSNWSLIQWEYIAPDIPVPLEYQSYLSSEEEIPDWVQRFNVPLSGTGLAGVIQWPLLIGTSYVNEAELHPLEAKTPGGATWRLQHSVAAGKPTVLYFFSVQWLSIQQEEDFEAQMNFLEGLYDEFGREDLYIFGVTDESVEVLDWLGESGHTNFAPLLDEGSLMHAALNIDQHPYIVVFDAEGTVAALSKTYHPSTLDLIRDRIREVIEEAS
jgi:hypothetical protein